MIQTSNFTKIICSNQFNNNAGDYDDYITAKIIRLVVISISSVALFINIILIIKRKQYVFNTIKLLMFVQIFYFISLVSVTPHTSDFNLNIFTKDGNNFHNLTECLVNQIKPFGLAIEGFVNLTAYSISYWFAVLITLYIKLVLANTYKQFMKRRGAQIFFVITLIILWYLVPFIMTFFNDAYFSFGPAGYKYKDVQYFFYSGIVNRYEKTGGTNQQIGNVFVIFWMLFMPIVLFIYHCKLLWHNHKEVKKLKQLDELNPRQYFIIKSGNLSFIIFFVQIFNVTKLIWSLLIDTDWIALFTLNVVYDLLALMLIISYFKSYYHQGRNLQEKSHIADKSLIQTFSSHQSSII